MFFLVSNKKKKSVGLLLGSFVFLTATHGTLKIIIVTKPRPETEISLAQGNENNSRFGDTRGFRYSAEQQNRLRNEQFNFGTDKIFHFIMNLII